MVKRLVAAALMIALGMVGAAPTSAHVGLVYVSPLPGARFVTPGTTLALRTSAPLAAQQIGSAVHSVVGSKSGGHSGTTTMAADGRTLIFTPSATFAPAETVTVTLDATLASAVGSRLPGSTYSFTTSAAAPTQPAGALAEVPALQSAPAAAPELHAAAITYETLPSDFPEIAITATSRDVAPGYLFLSNFDIFTPSASKPYLLIVDNRGEPVYYRRFPDGTNATDFKKQPNGLLTYWNPVTSIYDALDTSYNVVDTFQAGNGYPTDLHELQLLPNGHALLMIYDPQTIDMSAVVPGGNPNATVVGLVVQELDSAKNVVFEWRSWDHFQFTDSTVALTTPLIDYVHGNAIALDFDGNLLISSRHMDEITKINRQTGAVIWRWGGKNNQFTFVGGDPPFVHQHDVRRLPGGTITLFDNRTFTQNPYSRAIEYRLDEFNKTATPVWQYRNTPDVYTIAMGGAQRLPNGNTLIGWGSGHPTATEVRSDGTKAFELAFVGADVSYRAFRFPWQGAPTEPPTLVATTDECSVVLSYSWNGATEIGSYRVYGGTTDEPSTLLAVQLKESFETRTVLPTNPRNYTHFQIMPLDRDGAETQRSNVATADTSACTFPSRIVLPLLHAAPLGGVPAP